MFKKNINFSEAEIEVLKFWKENKCFEQCMDDSKNKPEFVFFDGPPFATGLPHYGHILSGSIKDTVGRFWHQQGYRVVRRFGWDCHGLPVEYEIDKKLNITDRRQVLEMGIDKYNDACKSIVMKYSNEWEATVERMGRWVDFKGGYKTMDKSFMESVWYIFKALWDKNKIYRGFRVMPVSTACKTPISNFEANQNYKEVSDPSVLIKFPLLNKINGREASLVVWTTTPWTLPSNLALLVRLDFKYEVVDVKGAFYILHEKKADLYFKDYTVVEIIEGKELVGLEYSQPFDFYDSMRTDGWFKIYPAKFIDEETGTAIVHCAPAFGEDDYNAMVECGLLKVNQEVPCPIDENGQCTLEKYKGIYFKDLDKIVLNDIKNRVLMNNRCVHNYPYCWRSDTPLIYKLVSNWFINVKDSVADLLKNNEKINWIPEDIKYKRFHNWLAQARDWAVSRNRFWGTPIPIWTTEDYSDFICIGSVAELERFSGRKISNLHREFIDDIVIELNGKVYRRVEEVLDCWFESGSMPYAQDHWPFNLDGLSNLNITKKDFLEKSGLPAQFIGEGLDQTRGWFYTLHVISTMLFDSPAFENVIVNGIVLADNGKKMSKREKNYPDPNIIFEKYGADALRLYLLNTPVVLANNLRFNEGGVKEVLKVLLIPWHNALSFSKDCLPNEQSLEMDAWIVASYNNFCFSVTENVKNYKLNTVLLSALNFINDVTNWYIRINRKQLRAGAGLLIKILKDFCVVMGPFSPFFSEYCYQSLLSEEEEKISVHRCLYKPTAPETHPFEKAKAIIEAVRQMREKLKLKVRRPLKAVQIVCNRDFENIAIQYTENIQTECNILEVSFVNEEKYVFESTVKPYFDNLKKAPETMKQKIEIIKNLDKESQLLLLKNSSCVIDGVEILRDDVLVFKEISGKENSQTFEDFGVIIDVEYNSQIHDLFNAREFFSFVQKMRKASGFLASDKVLVKVDNEYIKKVVSESYSDILFGADGVLAAENEYPFEDSILVVQLFK